jgi:DNA-binding transcriptional LysR family regulator
MLDLRLLATFLAAASAPTFRQAASRLHLAPSTVTSRIRALEDELGLPLFARETEGAVLTEHGRRLVGHARRLLELAADTRRRLTGEDEACPELTVRFSESLGLALMPDILRRFRARHPQTRLTLVTHSRRGLARDLRQGVVDLAVLVGQPFVAEGVLLEDLGQQPLVVMAPPDDRLAGRGAVGPADLDGRRLLATLHVWSARRRLEDLLTACGAAPREWLECASLGMIISCVAAGWGLALAPRATARYAAARGLVAMLPWTGEALFAPVLLARPDDRSPTTAEAAFVQATREALDRADASPDPS